MQVAQVMDLVLNQMSMMSNNARSLGDSGEKDDDDEDETEDDEGNDDGDNSDGNDDDDDNDGNEYGDSDHERIESDRYENPNLNQSSEEHKEEEEENVDEFTDKEDDDDNAKEENKEELDDAEELYKDVKEEKDAHVTLTTVHDTQKTEGPMPSSSVSSDFIKKLLNFKNVSLVDNETASLMDTIVRHEEPSSQTSFLYIVPVMIIPKITFTFTTTIPPPPSSVNPLLQQATPTTSEITTSFHALPDSSHPYSDSMIESPTWK
nr:hypothetical protein [Tanacetum cinerariifolium]